MPLVSVIVPVFKVEKYIVQCLDSICQQSLEDIEILLIDDATPDNCGKICDEYATKDSRITVFHNKTNQGLSLARNIGIRYASSDYLMFVDSDDYVHKDYCKIPYEYAVKANADLIMFRYARISNTSNNSKAEPVILSGYKTKNEALDLLLSNIGFVAWNKLYSKKLFQDISYPVGFYYEDVGTTYKTILHANKIYYVDIILYYYNSQRLGSITSLNTEKIFLDRTKMYLQQYRDLIEWGYPIKKLEKRLLDLSMNYCIKIKPKTTDFQYDYCTTILRTTKTIPMHFSWKKKVLFILFNNCKPLFELICKIWNKKID